MRTWFRGINIYSNCEELSLGFPACKSTKNRARTCLISLAVEKMFSSFLPLFQEKFNFSTVSLCCECFMLNRRKADVEHNRGFCDERPSRATKKSGISSCCDGISKECNEDKEKVRNGECEIVFGSLCKLGWQTYTTPTVRDIFAFAVLFWFLSLDLSLLHTCFWRALYAVLLGGILSRWELFDCAIANFFRRHRSAWFPLLSTCRFAKFDTSVVCHVLILCLGSFL